MKRKHGGHDAGDCFLKEVGKRIRTAIANPDTVIARLGGDEFAVILNHIDVRQLHLKQPATLFMSLSAPSKSRGLMW
jgi:diguanylate cyclase (GGDEF)-like protein